MDLIEIISNKIGYKLLYKMVQFLSVNNKKLLQEKLMNDFEQKDNSIKQRILNIIGSLKLEI